MADPDRERVSRLRQVLRQTEEERGRSVAVVLGELGPLVRGSYFTAGVRCGKPGCKCVRGELHPTAMLRVSRDGTSATVYVPEPDRERVERLSRSYRRLRKARAELVRLGKKSVELTDALQEAITEPYPPADRSASGRGRRRKGKGG